MDKTPESIWQGEFRLSPDLTMKWHVLSDGTRMIEEQSVIAFLGDYIYISELTERPPARPPIIQMSTELGRFYGSVDTPSRPSPRRASEAFIPLYVHRVHRLISTLYIYNIGGRIFSTF